MQDGPYNDDFCEDSGNGGIFADENMGHGPLEVDARLDLRFDAARMLLTHTEFEGPSLSHSFLQPYSLTDGSEALPIPADAQQVYPREADAHAAPMLTSDLTMNDNVSNVPTASPFELIPTISEAQWPAYPFIPEIGSDQNERETQIGVEVLDPWYVPQISLIPGWTPPLVPLSSMTPSIADRHYQLSVPNESEPVNQTQTRVFPNESNIYPLDDGSLELISWLHTSLISNGGYLPSFKGLTAGEVERQRKEYQKGGHRKASQVDLSMRDFYDSLGSFIAGATGEYPATIRRLADERSTGPSQYRPAVVCSQVKITRASETLEQHCPGVRPVKIPLETADKRRARDFCRGLRVQLNTIGQGTVTVYCDSEGQLQLESEEDRLTRLAKSTALAFGPVTL